MMTIPPSVVLVSVVACIGPTTSFVHPVGRSMSSMRTRNDPKRQHIASARLTSLGSAIAPSDEPDRDSNPSTRFGTPISDALKELNKSSIDFLKSTVFDTFFEGEDRAYARFYAL